MKTVEPIRAMDPETILSSHLPPVIGRTSACLGMLAGFEPEAVPQT